MIKLHIDIETYSPENLAECGVYRYAGSPGFEILLVAYQFEGFNPETQIIDLASGETLPWEFVDALQDPNVQKIAHNATFERVCFSNYLRRLGKLQEGEWLDPYQWHCTMVQCYRCGLPGKLEDAGAVLGLEKQKMTEGKNLIKLFCTPHKAASGVFGETPERVRPEDRPEEWATFKAYCIRDVDVEKSIDKATAWYKVSDFEQRLYAIDQTINDRGVAIDLQMVQNAVKIHTTHKAKLNVQAAQLTGLSNPNSNAQLKGWLNAVAGLELDSLNKTSVQDIQAKVRDPRVQRVLQIRAEMQKTSNEKYNTMLDAVCTDGRVHGLLQFYGTRTGRWAGRLVQMQNLPQNHLDGEDLDLARQAVKIGDSELLALNYGNVPDTLSQLIRTAFIPSEGKYYAVCDFSAIEARVLAWMANEEWLLEVFRTHGKVYEATAAEMYHCDISEITKTDPRRQKGKIAVLALGYGGNVGALDQMGGKRMGLTEQDEAAIVEQWREANPNIVKFWSTVDKAAKDCATCHKTVKTKRLTFEMQDNGTMTITLPSGRPIAYPGITGTTNRFGGQSLKFKGLNQETKKWGWVETYGGKLTENIIQAIARDCLAETMVKVEAAGFPVVFHVHDELICEVENTADLAKIQDIFKAPITWAEGLPLKGAGYTGSYYFKD